jgi:hypothetical protein
MNRYKVFVFLLLSIFFLESNDSKADTILPEHFASSSSRSITRSNIPSYNGPLDKAAAIVDKGYDALTYIGRDDVVDSLNNVSNAANNLVEKGVTLHFGPHKIIPQIAFCAVGILASVCGLGLITYTVLQKDQKDTGRKYFAGAGMITLGMASLAAGYWLSTNQQV